MPARGTRLLSPTLSMGSLVSVEEEGSGTGGSCMTPSPSDASIVRKATRTYPSPQARDTVQVKPELVKGEGPRGQAALGARVPRIPSLVTVRSRSTRLRYARI